MNIAYVYIEKYKHLENIGYNFLSNHKFDFEDEKITYKGVTHLNNLYGNINITAIIGENGTGKSSILNFLTDLKFMDEKLTNFLLISMENNKFIVYLKRAKKIYKADFNIEVNEILSITQVMKSSNLFSELKNYNSLDILELFENKPDKISIIKKMVYFSNIFDGTAMMRKSSSKDFYNISTNYLLNESKDSYEDFKTFSNENLKTIANLLDMSDMFLSFSLLEKIDKKDPYEYFKNMPENKEKIEQIENLYYIYESFNNTYDTYKKNIDEIYRTVVKIEELTNPVHYFFIEEFKRQIDLFCYISKSENDYSLINSVNIPEHVELSLRPNIEAGKLYKKNSQLNSFLIKHWSYTKEYPEELVDYKKNIFHFKLMFSALLYANNPLNLDKFEIALEEIMKINEN